MLDARLMSVEESPSLWICFRLWRDVGAMRLSVTSSAEVRAELYVFICARLLCVGDPYQRMGLAITIERLRLCAVESMVSVRVAVLFGRVELTRQNDNPPQCQQAHSL